MSSRDAQLLANQQGVDLVEIAANASPPVVKIIDWGKYQYQKMKEEAKNRKKAREKQSELKQMKIGLKISDNDLMYYIANLVTRIAKKNKMSVYDVLASLNTGIKEQGEFY